jgi:hypothetical protein
LNLSDNIEVLVDILITIKGKDNSKALDSITNVEALVDKIIGIKHNIDKIDIIAYLGAGMFLIGFMFLLVTEDVGILIERDGGFMLVVVTNVKYLLVGLIVIGMILILVRNKIKYPSLSFE